MFTPPRLHVLALGLVTGLLVAGERAQTTVTSQDPSAQDPGPEVGARALEPERFVGYWDYNAQDSINAATGRPEQVPVSATALNPGAPQARPRNRTVDGTGRSGRGGFEAGIYRSAPSVTAHLIRVAQSFLRDLLEVPEGLAIQVTPEAVTFTDDLERSLTFPTDGRQRDYQLSASKFEARMTWDAGIFQKEVEGGGGYRMTEAYFLSTDAQRLFVIVRAKGPRSRNTYVAAFNRVYDRVESWPPQDGSRPTP